VSSWVPTGGRDLGGLKGAKGDLCSNAIELGLAVGGKKSLVGVKSQKDQDKEGG